ncbi:helix-turn-helix domain-containing protein [Actinokineospora sp. G85]|uniref:helix-turn-helix domain-containing protein n=1 Tax=Actinokineospora sp. G85 TaxID=3406626 RepID=UPI003C7835AD
MINPASEGKPLPVIRHELSNPERDRQGGDVRAKNARTLLVSGELENNRRARGLTTRQLASAMGMSAAMVNRIMNGRKIPTAVQIGGLCAKLEVPKARRQIVYDLVRESERDDWIIDAPADEVDSSGIVSDLWKAAERVRTYTPTLSAPRIVGSETKVASAWVTGYANLRQWTHFMPASALKGTFDVRGERLLEWGFIDAIRIASDDGASFRHPVQVLEFPHANPVAICDLDYTIIVLEDEKAKPYLRQMEALSGSALPATDSRALIEETSARKRLSPTAEQ